MGVLDVAAKIAADKEQVEELAAMLAASKEKVTQTAGALSGMGIDRSAAQVQQVADVIEEAESLQAALVGGLQKAHWQAMSAVHGNLGPGAYGSGPGGRIVPQTQGGGADGGPQPGGLDAIPPHLRQEATPTGEELMGVDSSIGPFQKEHEGANDDQGKPKIQRFGRKVTRNTGDLVAASKQQTDVVAELVKDSYDPWGPNAHTTTEVNPGPHPAASLYRPEAMDVKASDVVGTTLVVTVIAVEGVSRLFRKKRDGK